MKGSTENTGAELVTRKQTTHANARNLAEEIGEGQHVITRRLRVRVPFPPGRPCCRRLGIPGWWSGRGLDRVARAVCRRTPGSDPTVASRRCGSSSRLRVVDRWRETSRVDLGYGVRRARARRRYVTSRAGGLTVLLSRLLRASTFESPALWGASEKPGRAMGRWVDGVGVRGCSGYEALAPSHDAVRPGAS